MSTQRADGNYSEIRIQSAGKDRIRSRSDHGNLGRFLGVEAASERQDNSEA